MSPRHILVCVLVLTLMSSCSGEDGQEGTTGPRGLSALFETSDIEPTEKCPQGGTRIRHGFDLDGNNVLSEIETTNERVICNGTNGSDGMDGRNGRNGKDVTTLILVSEEIPGTNCLQGGQKIDAGQDVNNNGVLDESEVDQTSYICNGSNAKAVLVNTSEEPIGINCVSGGVRIDSGVDEDSSGTLETIEIDQSRYVCNGNPAQFGVKVEKSPDPSTVFDNPDVCYVMTDADSSFIWDDVSGHILTGHEQLRGYWSFDAWTSGWPLQPTESTTEKWGKMVLVPGPRRVLVTDRYQSSALSDYFIADLDDQGVISNRQPVSLSDNFLNNCTVISNSKDDFLCLDDTDVRHYSVPKVSNVLTFIKAVPLDVPSENLANLEGNQKGGTFAWDGIYYYFSAGGEEDGNNEYLVFNSNGSFKSSYAISDSGNINAAYFNWSLGRYLSHDGFGARQEGVIYEHNQFVLFKDSHCFSPPSLNHINSK